MKKLEKHFITKIGKLIKEKGRTLEAVLFDNYFNEPCPDNVIDELSKYQNKDGGFGNALEPDFRLPLSSPMATSIALSHLSELDDNEKALEMIKASIKYLEKTYINERKGWLALSKEVNDYPHAPWWHFDEKEDQCIIDKQWGNPSAEIIGYFYKYKEFVKELNVDRLVDYAIDYFNQKETFKSFHEVYCFIKLYKNLPLPLYSRLDEKLKIAISQLISTNDDEWMNEYVAKPLDFVSDPKYRFGIDNNLIDKNLDYLVEFFTKNGEILPSWGNEVYGEDMKSVWNEWIGKLSLDALIKLDKFNRIQKMS